MAAPCRHLRNAATSRRLPLKGSTWDSRRVNPSGPQLSPSPCDALLMVVISVTPIIYVDFDAEDLHISSSNHKIVTHKIGYLRNSTGRHQLWFARQRNAKIRRDPLSIQTKIFVTSKDFDYHEESILNSCTGNRDKLAQPAIQSVLLH